MFKSFCNVNSTGCSVIAVSFVGLIEVGFGNMIASFGKKNFNFQKTENLGGKYMQVQCFSLKFLYSQLFCFLLAAF